MEITEQIDKFREFFELVYKEKLLEAVSKGQKSLSVDFSDLGKFDLELAQNIIDDPEDTVRAAEIATEKFDVNSKEFRIRFRNLPKTQQQMIRDIRSNHLAKFLQVTGIIRQKSDVRPQVTSARFECPACGNTMSVLQLDSKFREPTKCGCGRKGKFKLIGKEMVDAQKIVLEESPEDLEGSEQPKRLDVFLKGDLVSPLSEKKTNPGTKILLTGILKEVPILARDGGKLTRFDLMVEANHIETVAEDFTELNITEKEIVEIKELSEDPKLIKKLINSVAPSIYGHEKVKEALILQLFGGVRKKKDDGSINRGDIHILLIGDPGSGKSQMLKRVAVVAPKSRYVSGKGASAAGLTATVVKDEFLKGYALEAGALVLTNKGICCIDELDKMTKEDTSAMHEALEQQSFHHDTRITFADGSEQKIGEFIEEIFKKYPERIINGKDCQVISCKEFSENEFPKKILSTDWNTIFPTNIDRVSRHKAEKYFIKITATNGRSIIVTPEHPVFVVEQDKSGIFTKHANQLTGKEYLPIPLRIPINGEQQTFESITHNPRANTHILIPECNGKHIYRIAGYLLAEGSKELNRKKIIGINFTNKDQNILDDFEHSMYEEFLIRPYRQARIDDHDLRWMSRYISTELTTFFKKNLPEVLQTSSYKQIPALLLKGSKKDIAEMLSCMFEGDGHVSKKPRTIRIGYASNSKIMCEQLQDLLLRFSIRSNLTEHKKIYKVSITGYDNILRFAENIGFVSERKNNVVKEYLNTNKYQNNQNIDSKIKNNTRTIKDIVPIGKEILRLLQKYNIKLVGNNKIATMKHDYGLLNKNISRTHLQKAINILENKILEEDKTLFYALKQLAFGDIGFEKIKKIEIISNENFDQKWTYDVTIEPNHTFISANMILHNTISINKANISATLRAETTVLAAANPKFGRFDPYEIIPKQIDLPSTLINRFDLIFPIRDLPNKAKDERTADFILKLHKTASGGEADITTELLKKYIAYSRQNINPALTDAALEEIKEYYVKMRSTGEEDGSFKAIPISARQLEALIRLSEASARSRLSHKVTKADARRAIELVHFCLSEIGVDPETGKIDIDRISTGISASQRGTMAIIKEIIKELEENSSNKHVAIDEIIKRAKDKGFEEDKTEEVLDKLKKAGDIYTPKSGFISRI